MGPEISATQRLNLAQAFNPVGANIGVLLGVVLILPRITKDAEKASMTAQELESQEQVSLVLGPYLGIALALLVIWLLIAFRKIDTPDEHAHFGLEEKSGGALGRLWSNRHYRFGVVAQFLNVGAQVCAWSFTIQYALDVVGVSEDTAGWYLQASLIVFLIARFVMTYLLGIFRPTKLLFAMAALGVVLSLVAVFSPNMLGLIAVVGISLSLSLMFPTIYGVALRGSARTPSSVPPVWSWPFSRSAPAAGPGPDHGRRGHEPRLRGPGHLPRHRGRLRAVRSPILSARWSARDGGRRALTG